jgi:radical SAM superfamily enzyme YgiQ (UPF0313 family)
VGLLDAMMHEPQAPGICIRTTRDCPFACAFCIIGSSIYRGYDRKWRSMSAERTIAEIEHVVRTYGIRRFFFWDEVFTMDKPRAMALCDEIVRRGLDIEWRCLTRIDLLNEEMIAKMAAAGCKFIEFGIESGNQDARNEMNKKFSDEKAIRIVGLVREAGIRVNCDLIVGMPWETRETLDQTIALAKAIGADNIHLTSLSGNPLPPDCRGGEAAARRGHVRADARHARARGHPPHRPLARALRPGAVRGVEPGPQVDHPAPLRQEPAAQAG